MSEVRQQLLTWLEFASELGIDALPVRLVPAAPVASKAQGERPAPAPARTPSPATSPSPSPGLPVARPVAMSPRGAANDAAAFERMRDLLAPGPAAVGRGGHPAADPTLPPKPLARLAMPSTMLTGVVPASLADVQAEIGDDCRRCRLHEGRTKIVFGVGNPQAELMFVGEGPGFDEDLKGEPFVGKAGKLLTDIIKAIGMTREEVYIANVVKCRPPDNRTPEPDEAATCGQFLRKQLFLVKPKVIVALGRPATETLLERSVSITQLRGQVFDYHGAKLIPTFHPAYLLRTPASKREVWEDMKLVRDMLSGQR